MKKTQLERAIEALDADIAVLQAAKARLIQQQAKAPVRRRPRAVAQPIEKAAS